MTDKENPPESPDDVKSKGIFGNKNNPFRKQNYEAAENEMENYIEIDKTDEDIMKNPQKELKEGIETEEFDILPDFETTKEQMQALEEKEAINIEYQFNGDEVREALKLFQKETIYKRNIIYTVILLLIFCMYMFNLIKNPSQTLAYFLSVMCIAVVATIWYMPFSHIKKTAKAADTHELKFTMAVYDDCVKIGDEEGSFALSYNKQLTKIFETTKLFLLCAGKERMFILPKRCLEDGVCTKLRDLWELVMDKNYIKKM